MKMEKMPHAVVDVGPMLEPLSEFWEHWGFEPWSFGNLAGASRLQRFVKDGFLGCIAEYRAWDCIVWNSGTEEDRETLWRSLKPMPEVMTQRFVFLSDAPWPKRRIRSFFLGFRGYAEFYAHNPLQPDGVASINAKDLTELVHMGIRFSVSGNAAKNAS